MKEAFKNARLLRENSFKGWIQRQSEQYDPGIYRWVKDGEKRYKPEVAINNREQSHELEPINAIESKVDQ